MQQRKEIRKIPFVVISIFTVLWLLGVLPGEPQQVLAQAIRICLSCIGIG